MEHQATLLSSLVTPLKPSYDDYAQELVERFQAANQTARESLKEKKGKSKISWKAKKIKFKVG